MSRPPRGRGYATIAADPPWPLPWSTGTVRKDGRGTERRTLKKTLEYPVMSIDAICALTPWGVPVTDLAPPDAHLYLWVPDRFLIDGSAARVARAWGFDPGRLLLDRDGDTIAAAALAWWTKRGYGLGRFPRPQHEAILVCRRGHLEFQVNDVGSVHLWKQPYENGARKHSAKPEGAGDLIERASPGPYLELFARRGRLGWDHWGDQALQGAGPTAARAGPELSGAAVPPGPDPAGAH